MATSDPFNTGYAPLLDNISKRFGFTDFEIFNSGGGCLIAQTRLEGTAWMWITDWDAGIQRLHDRNIKEANGITLGYNVSIYATDPDNHWCDDCTALASVRHETAKAADLAGLVQLALSSLPRNAHHTFDKNGEHRIEYGVRHF
ncbi:MAG TPA: hypothetical protein VMU34_15265 [Mycobacterium sp.]|nr:hypothetical protein [Mycobacterium sp.]